MAKSIGVTDGGGTIRNCQQKQNALPRQGGRVAIAIVGALTTR
jgi:hypothetical protein